MAATKSRFSVGVIAALICVAVLSGFAFARGYAVVPLLLVATAFFLTILGWTIQKPLAAITTLFFLLPFERIPSFVVGGATVRLSQIMLLCLIIGSTLRLLTTKAKLNFSIYLYPYLFFVASLILSFWHMQALSRGLTVFVFVLFTSLALWVVPSLITKEEHIVRVTRALFIVTVIICIFGVYQFVGDMIGLPTALTGLRELYTKIVFGFPRVQATALEPLYLANFLIIPLSLAIAYAVRGLPQYRTRLYASVIGLGTLVMILTLARGGYLGFAASLGVLFTASLYKFLRPTVVMAGLGIILVLAIGVGGLFRFSNLGQKSIDITTTHFTQISQDASTLDRFGSFQDAVNAFEQHPWTGVGIGNYGPWTAHYPNELPPDGWRIVNNEPLEILAEMGIIGLLSTLVLVALLFWRTVQAIFITKNTYLRATLVGLLAAGTGIVVQYQFFSTLYIMHIWVLFGLMVAVQNIVSREHQS